MGLAVVPTDWTDQYIDVCVNWPNSPEWLSILRGQLTEPYDAKFWDKFTGDPTDAQTAIEATFNQNLHVEVCMNVPIGIMWEYGGVSEPTGWMFCHGQELSRSTYAALFAVIGERFGVGNGTTTFNLPDRRGKVHIGWSDTDFDFNDVGNTGGAKTHTLTTAQLAAHNHTQNAHNHTQTAHNHTQTAHNHTQTAHAHNRNTDGQGETIFDDTVGSGSFGAAAGSRQTLTYSVTGNATPAIQNATPAIQNATPAIQDTTPTNNNAGSGSAHNNLQPYLVSEIIIKVE